MQIVSIVWPWKKVFVLFIIIRTTFLFNFTIFLAQKWIFAIPWWLWSKNNLPWLRYSQFDSNNCTQRSNTFDWLWNYGRNYRFFIHRHCRTIDLVISLVALGPLNVYPIKKKKWHNNYRPVTWLRRFYLLVHKTWNDFRSSVWEEVRFFSQLINVDYNVSS